MATLVLKLFIIIKNKILLIQSGRKNITENTSSGPHGRFVKFDIVVPDHKFII